MGTFHVPIEIGDADDPKTVLRLRMMGFVENFHRLDLLNKDRLLTIKGLKGAYDRLYPETTNQGRHLAQERTQDGRLGKSHARPGFVREIARATGRPERTIRQEIQLAELLDLEILDAKYNRPIPKTVGVILMKLSKAEQGPLLHRLAKEKKPITIQTVGAAVTRRLEQLTATADSASVVKRW